MHYPELGKVKIEQCRIERVLATKKSHKNTVFCFWWWAFNFTYSKKRLLMKTY